TRLDREGSMAIRIAGLIAAPPRPVERDVTVQQIRRGEGHDLDVVESGILTEIAVELIRRDDEMLRGQSEAGVVGELRTVAAPLIRWQPRGAPRPAFRRALVRDRGDEDPRTLPGFGEEHEEEGTAVRVVHDARVERLSCGRKQGEGLQRG